MATVPRTSFSGALVVLFDKTVREVEVGRNEGGVKEEEEDWIPWRNDKHSHVIMDDMMMGWLRANDTLCLSHDVVCTHTRKNACEVCLSTPLPPRPIGKIRFSLVQRLTCFNNSSAVDRVICLFQAHALSENSLCVNVHQV